jgi:hypothetical protein
MAGRIRKQESIIKLSMRTTLKIEIKSKTYCLENNE